jgi:thiol-disulfide isomerase/thioredoxin
MAIAVFLVSALVFLFVPECRAISWESDLTKAFEEAKSDGRFVMADFYTDWCGWCKKLDKDVYEDAGVNKLAERFICVKVNCEIDKGAFAKYKLKGYPTIIFFNAKGDIEEMVIGYRTAKVFTEIINNMIDKMPRSAVAQPVASADKPVIKEKKVENEFELAGIMGSKAIINKKVVAVGDEVNGAKVTAITKNCVKLQCEDKELTLSMRQE